jgi:transcriptional regulator with XRE-family HTH domain
MVTSETGMGGTIMKGARIAALRRQAGMSQAQLAGQLGVSPSAVGMYEQGRREPSSEVLVELGKLFGVSVDYILTGAPSPQEEARLQQLLMDRITAADRMLRERKDRPFTRQELAVLFAAMLIEP